MDARITSFVLALGALSSVAATYPTPNFVVTAETAKIAKQVGDHACSQSQASGAANTRKQSTYNQTFDIGREGTADLPNDEKPVGSAEHDSASIDLAQGGEQEWTKLYPLSAYPFSMGRQVHTEYPNR